MSTFELNPSIFENSFSSNEVVENGDDSDSDIEILEDLRPKEVPSNSNFIKDSGYNSDIIDSPAKPEISSNEVSDSEDEHCEECGQFLNKVSFHSFNGGISEKEALEFFDAESKPSLKMTNASVFDSVGHLVSFKRVS